MLTLEQMAERQDGVVSVAQAVMTGVSRGQLTHRCRTRRYRRPRRRVVVVAGAPPTWRQAVRAASLAAGKGVVVSHASAARLYGVDLGADADRDVLEVSGQLPRKVRLEGVRSHRSGTFVDGDLVQRAGMACTSPLRLVIDMSSRLGPHGTGKLVDELIRRRLLKLGDLVERLPLLRPAPGRSVKTLRSVVAARWKGFDPGESPLESRLIRFIKRAGFPLPVQQHWVRERRFKARLDFAYPDAKVFLEGDGFGFHSSRSAFESDSRRRNHLVASGWLPITLTSGMSQSDVTAILGRFYDRSSGCWTLPR